MKRGFLSAIFILLISIATISVKEVYSQEDLCGNGIVDGGENCAVCPQDVVCKAGEICVNDKCTSQKSSNYVVVVIAVIVVLLIGISIAFYIYKKKQQELGLENIAKEMSQNKSPEIPKPEDFYKEPEIKPQVKASKVDETRKVNKSLLRTYVKEATYRGHSKERIKENLLSTGWKEQDIDDALKEIR